MKKLFFIILLLLSNFCFAQNNQTIIAIDSDIYTALKTLYLEQGLSVPSTSIPYSLDEVIWTLKRVHYNTLSENGKNLYDYITDELKSNPLYTNEGRISFKARLNANIESYLHTNSDFTGWQYGYKERLPMLNNDLELWLFDSTYAFMGSEFKKEMFVVEGEKNNYTNLIFDFKQTDLHIPYRGFFSFGAEHWNIQLGREQTSWGNGINGDLLLSDNADFYDQFRLQTYWKTFKFSTIFITQPLWNRSGSFNQGYPVSSGSMSGRFKIFVAHRYEWRVFDRVNIAFTEACLFTSNTFELKFLNPLLVYHNFFMDEYANPIMSFEIEANPFRYINLYGQICFDQITSNFEKENYASDAPNAWAYLLGIEGIIPLGPGYLETGYEWIYTDPWMYLQDYPRSLTVSRRILSNYLPGRIIVDKPMGFWGGPDSIFHSVSAGYRVYDKFYISTDLTFLIQGENSSLTDFPDSMPANAADMRTPSGSNSQKTGVIHLHGEINLLKFLSLSSDLYFVKVWDYQHTNGAEEADIQWIFSVLFTLEK